MTKKPLNTEYQTPGLVLCNLKPASISRPLCGSFSIPDLKEEEGDFEWE